MGVGKTSIITRFKDNEFYDDQASTIGTAFATCVFTEDGIKHRLSLWDTAGQERFRSLAPLYYRGITAAILVYNVTDRSTYENLAEYWITSIRSHATSEGRSVIMCIVGNKCDLPPEDHQVTTEEAQTFATNTGCMFVETSAKTGDNIADIFHEIAKLVGERSKPDDKKASSAGGGTRLSDHPGADQSRGRCC